MKQEDKNKEEGGGNHFTSSLKNKHRNYTISFQDIPKNYEKIIRELGCKVESGGITGNHEQIEAFMKLQNPMHQTKCNSSRSLNGAWNPQSRKLEPIMPR